MFVNGEDVDFLFIPLIGLEEDGAALFSPVSGMKGKHGET